MVNNLLVSAKLLSQWLLEKAAAECQLCGCFQPKARLCHNCQALLDARQYQRCIRCAVLLPTETPDLECGACLRSPPPFHRTLVCGDYVYPWSIWIKRFKSDRDLTLGTLLAERLCDKIRLEYEEGCLPDLLVPVPLHQWRLFQRGFNQAEWLARQLNSQLECRTLLALRKTRATTKQQGSNRKTRHHNVKGAFEVDPTLRQQLNNANHIALIDDVVTTQTTAREAAKTLLAAGVKRVDLWCIARTPSPSDPVYPGPMFHT